MFDLDSIFLGCGELVSRQTLLTGTDVTATVKPIRKAVHKTVIFKKFYTVALKGRGVNIY